MKLNTTKHKTDFFGQLNIMWIYIYYISNTYIKIYTHCTTCIYTFEEREKENYLHKAFNVMMPSLY